MGNQITRIGNGHHKKTDTSAVDGNTQVSNTATQSTSVTDNGHNYHMQFFPIDSLAKILLHHAHQEEYANGITKTVFTKYLFPGYPELAHRIFTYLHHNSKATAAYLTVSNFKQQMEKFLAVMNDQTILENYIKIFSNITESGDITAAPLKELLMISYRLTINRDEPAECPYLHKVIDSVVTSCFHGKDSLSTSYTSNWIWQHCPRLVNGLHRYVVHILMTAYRNDKDLFSKEQPPPYPDFSIPVIDLPETTGTSNVPLPSSYVWLLCCSLPYCYLQVNDTSKDVAQALIAKTAGSLHHNHWSLLYNSNEHGSGANRFLHHVLGYRGPTLLLIRAENPDKDAEDLTYCICSTTEWRESHHYWGDEDSIAIELFPAYRVLEKGSKTIYLNTSIRGYPHGIRFGSNPRSPCISIDESFNSVSFAGAPYRISKLEVWGCGDKQLRDRQLDIKKWQVKEAEKQRVVKLSANDWLDHPDRYLLELAGRACYNNESNSNSN